MDTANSTLDLLLDDEQYLVNANAWNPEIARMLANRFGIEKLTEDHWSILWHIRRHYLEHGTLPSIGHVCKANNIDRARVSELFAHGCLQAWRVAGLPDPGVEAATYLSNESP